MSAIITKKGSEKAEKMYLDKTNWGFTEYQPEVYATITYDETGFDVEFVVKEANPLREKTNHFDEVCEDSCVEFFVNFDPENTNEYINFEVNANGAMQASLRTDRYNYRHLTIPEIENLGITADIKEEEWSVKYKVSTELIKKYYPKFDINTCKYITGNMQKCGDKQKTIHYMSLFEIACETPDFHRPEYFGRIELM